MERINVERTIINALARVRHLYAFAILTKQV